MGSRGEETLATADEVRALAKRALDLVLANRGWDDDATDEEQAVSNLRVWAGREAARYCGAAAALTGDPSLIDDLVPLFEMQGEFDDWDDHGGTIARGIGTLIERLPAPNATVRGLAAHESPALREQVASGLKPASEAAIALLETLAQDPSPEVRQSARKTLEPVRPVAWWRGKFAHDPFARLSPDEAKLHADTIGKISATLDKPWYTLRDEIPALTKLIATIPPSLALELAEQIFNADDFWAHGKSYDLLVLAVGLPGGEELFLRIAERWSVAAKSYYLGLFAGKALAEADKALRVRLCARLLGWILPRALVRDEDTSNRSHFAVSLIEEAWPKDADATPLLDELLAASIPADTRYNYVVSATQNLISESQLPAQTLRRALSARAEGLPGPWAALDSVVSKLTARLPASVVRPVALRLLGRAESDPPAVAWALRAWLTQCYDRRRDGTRSALAQRIWDERKWRDVAMKQHDLQPYLLVPGRRALRAGQCTFVEAGEVLKVLGRLYGGLPGLYLVPSRIESAEAEAEQQEKRCAAYPGWLGPKSLQGPPSDAEWEAFRALRARASFTDGEAWRTAVEVLPRGPWAAAERELFRRAFDADARDEELGLELFLAVSLGHHGEAEDLSLFVPLQERVARRTGHRRDELIQQWQQYAHQRLGVPLPEQRGEPSGPTLTGNAVPDDEGEWMDQDDDES